ncbi:MAG: single-stranded DNA-binding protein [Salinibacterium sp.]|nr:single-stranded DNA-binding protein [Salinibacterium sp.]
MQDIITITGLVATDPRHIVTSEGLSITSFRLASAQRRFDRSQERWIDGETNWYTITSFRQLALNCASSILKGQRVLITGRLRIREWDNGERVGTTIDIEAEAVGHDLAWGTATFSRSIASSAAAEPEQPQSPAAEGAQSPEVPSPATPVPVPEPAAPF